MKSFTNHSLFALAVVALMSSCSRPYATFQKTTPDHFYAKSTATPVVEAPTVIEATTPVITVEGVQPATTHPATVNEALDQLEAVASAKAGPSETKQIQKRVARIRTLMAAVPAKASVANTTAAPN